MRHAKLSFVLYRLINTVVDRGSDQCSSNVSRKHRPAPRESSLSWTRFEIGSCSSPFRSRKEPCGAKADDPSIVSINEQP